MENHNIPPVWNEKSRILILGSFPSVKSRSDKFFYAHPQNRFWLVIAAITESPLPKSVEEKKEMLLKNNIALWDVIRSCNITGSADSSIKNVVPNDIAKLILNSNITAVFANGTTAYNLYKKYCADTIGIEAIKLPSTSPANAAFSFERLADEWKIVADCVKKPPQPQ